jgi:hypothetical protein
MCREVGNTVVVPRFMGNCFMLVRVSLSECIFLYYYSGLSSRAAQGAGLRLLTCWDRRFESRRGHGCLSLVSVVCYQVEVSASG